MTKPVSNNFTEVWERFMLKAFLKRILSSLLFSGVLSIPGNAAATRRNSYKTKSQEFKCLTYLRMKYKVNAVKIVVGDLDKIFYHSICNFFDILIYTMVS